MNMIAEIRGMFARPPAKLLVESLAAGVELKLVREASNAYDVNAVQCWMPLASLDAELVNPGEEKTEKQATFEMKLMGFGWDLERLRASPELKLGYVGKEWAAILAPLMDADAERVESATFCVSGAGKPQVRIELKP